MTDPDSQPFSATLTALEAFTRGYTPIPIRPGQKRPLRGGWDDLAFESEADVRSYFTEAEETYRSQHRREHGTDPEHGLNVGLRLGEPSGGLVDIDLDHPKASRLASLILPRTAMRHGRPSRPFTHWWYLASDALPAYRKFMLPEGETLMELRSTGQQTLIPRSLHPDEERYTWHGQPWGGDRGPERLRGKAIQARVLTLALMGTLLVGWPQSGGRHDAYLALAGGLLRYGGVDGETGAVHPLWEQQLPNLIRILAEATSDEDGPDTRVHEVFDSTMKKLRAGRKVQGFPTLGRIIGGPLSDLVLGYAKDIETLLDYPSRAGLRPVEDIELQDLDPADVTRHRSAQEARRRDLDSLPDQDRDPLAERTDSWETVNLRLYLTDEFVGPQTGVLHRDDHLGLLYEGRLNSLYGASESGKTWLAMRAIRDIIAAGGHAMLIDCEDIPDSAIERLRLLGLTDDQIAERFAYIAPETQLAPLMTDRWGHPSPNETGRNNELALHAALDLIQPELIVVDGLTALYGLHSLNPNDGAATDRVASWLRKLCKFEGGERTVLMIDHTSKNATVGSAPTGSQHKIAMVQGAALHVTATTKPRRGRKGELQVYVGKDRHGHVVSALLDDHEDDRLIAEVVVDSTEPGRVTVALQPPMAGTAVVDTSGRKPRSAATPKRDTSAGDQDLLLKALGMGREPMRRGEIELAMLPEKLPENRYRSAIAELLRTGRVKGSGSGAQTRYSLPT